MSIVLPQEIIDHIFELSNDSILIRQNKEIVSKFIYYNTYKDIFDAIEQEADIECIKYIMSKMDNIDIQNKNGYTALELASLKGNLEVVKVLIDSSANVHAWNDVSICWASENGHLEVVKTLIENGADPCANDNEPLRWASTYGHIEVVEYLKSKGAKW